MSSALEDYIANRLAGYYAKKIYEIDDKIEAAFWKKWNEDAGCVAPAGLLKGHVIDKVAANE